MKVVIDIDKNDYIALRDCHAKIGEDLFNLERNMAIAIRNGIPLPKGHGDLIDRNVAYDVLDNADLSLNCSGLLKYIPTVIPADKGE